jgi:hypothetical protein
LLCEEDLLLKYKMGIGNSLGVFDSLISRIGTP